MEVFQRMHRLDRCPIFEPDDLQSRRDEVSLTLTLNCGATYLFRSRRMSERLVDVSFSLCTRSVCQVASLLVLFEGELHPHNEMDDLAVDAIGPVIVKDLEIASLQSARHPEVLIV